MVRVLRKVGGKDGFFTADVNGLSVLVPHGDSTKEMFLFETFKELSDGTVGGGGGIRHG
jgi:hypothetical protein